MSIIEMLSLQTDPQAVTIICLIAALLVIAPCIIFVLDKLGKLSPAKKSELTSRTVSWFWLCVCILIPILAGPIATILAITALCLFCLREFCRATGLHREIVLTACTVIGILLVNFAAADRWYNLHSALASLVVVAIAGIAVFADRPSGYLQRTALACFGFLFFGHSLSYASVLTSEPQFRSILLMILLATELNDVFAYICGHIFGRNKLAPLTSPGKTREGAIGALVLTTGLVTGLVMWIFEGTVLDSLVFAVPLGIIVSVVGQVGDLMLSSIKRDVGIKDLGTAIPGHGGFLDRFDSLVLVMPAVYHYLNYFLDFSDRLPVRIFTNGGLP